MQAGHKISVHTFFADLDRIGIHPIHADENLERVLEDINNINYVVYKEELNPYYSGEPGFIFRVNNGGVIIVPYGPKGRDIIIEKYMDRLYFRKKIFPSQEEEFYADLEKVWKAGL